MLVIFLLSCPALILAYYALPQHFGLSFLEITGVPTELDLAFGLVTYFAGFFGGTLQLYNLAERGFSLRLLIDIDESPRNAADVQRLLYCYGGGQGIVWMYDKRLQGLKSGRFVIAENCSLALTDRGRRIARIFIWLHGCIGLGNPSSSSKL